MVTTMTTLLMSSRHSRTNASPWRAAMGRAWSVVRARGIRLPEIDDFWKSSSTLEGPLRTGPSLGLIDGSCAIPAEDWLGDVRTSSRKRERITYDHAGQARGLTDPASREAPERQIRLRRSYESGARLPQEFDADMPVLVSEPSVGSGVRCFCLDGKVWDARLTSGRESMPNRSD